MDRMCILEINYRNLRNGFFGTIHIDFVIDYRKTRLNNLN